MTKFVSIYANGDDGQVVTVTEAFAKGVEAKALDFPALDSRGRPLGPRSAEDAEKQKVAAEEAVKATEKSKDALDVSKPDATPDATSTPPGGARSNPSPSGAAGTTN